MVINLPNKQIRVIFFQCFTVFTLYLKKCHLSFLSVSHRSEGGCLGYICDPPYDFRDKGDNTLTTRFHLKTKEIDFNTPTKHARAHFNEPVLLSHITQ